MNDKPISDEEFWRGCKETVENLIRAAVLRASKNYEASLAEIRFLNEKLDVSDRANSEMLKEIKKQNIEIEALKKIVANFQGCLT